MIFNILVISVLVFISWFFFLLHLVWDLPGSWIFCWNLHIFTFYSEALNLMHTICFIWLFFDTALAGEGRWRCCLITARCPAEHSQPFLKPFSWSPIQCSLASVPIISDYTEWEVKRNIDGGQRRKVNAGGCIWVLLS